MSVGVKDAIAFVVTAKSNSSAEGVATIRESFQEDGFVLEITQVATGGTALISPVAYRIDLVTWERLIMRFAKMHTEALQRRQVEESVDRIPTDKPKRLAVAEA